MAALRLLQVRGEIKSCKTRSERGSLESLGINACSTRLPCQPIWQPQQATQDFAPELNGVTHSRGYLVKQSDGL